MYQNTAIFRANASPSIGGGHIIRCISLANELSNRGWNCVFASDPETLKTMPIVTDFKVIKLKNDNSADEAKLIYQNYAKPISVMVVDSSTIK